MGFSGTPQDGLLPEWLQVRVTESWARIFSRLVSPSAMAEIAFVSRITSNPPGRFAQNPPR